MNREKWKYIELRPMVSFRFRPGDATLPSTGEEFYFHKLDLRPDLQTIFHNFHKSCVQRKIQRGERENLEYEAGRSERILDKFYGLLLLTRRRHQLPPQPLLWFRNLLECLGDRLTIRVVSKEGQPIASILTISVQEISHLQIRLLGRRDSITWAGCRFFSGKQFKRARHWEPTNSTWVAARVDNSGLANFKERLGARASRLVYLRIERNLSYPTTTDWKVRCVRKAISHMPDPFLKLVANRFYRFVG